MITRQLKTMIRSHLCDLVQTSTDRALHAVSSEIAVDGEMIRIAYEVWFVTPDRFDYTNIGAIWNESAIMWIYPGVTDSWHQYGAGGSHSDWRELWSNPADIRDPDIPRAAVVGWLDWMSLEDKWDDLIDYYEGEGESFLKGYPRGSRKAFRQAKEDRRRRNSLPRPVSYSGSATGMGIFTLAEYQELMQEDDTDKK